MKAFIVICVIFAATMLGNSLSIQNYVEAHYQGSADELAPQIDAQPQPQPETKPVLQPVLLKPQPQAKSQPELKPLQRSNDQLPSQPLTTLKPESQPLPQPKPQPQILNQPQPKLQSRVQPRSLPKVQSKIQAPTQPQPNLRQKTASKNSIEIVKAKNGNCYAPRQVNDHGVCTCPDRKNYVPERNQCICPTYAPFWNGQFCSGCPPGMDFNLDLGICYVCPQGFIRGYKVMTCIPGLLGTPRQVKNFQ